MEESTNRQTESHAQEVQEGTDVTVEDALRELELGGGAPSYHQTNREGCLLPMQFNCYSSNIANHEVLVQRLRLILPEGTRMFGFQTTVLRLHPSSEFRYDYRILLWPPSDCDPHDWQYNADARDVLHEKQIPCKMGYWIVPFSTALFTAADIGRRTLVYLLCQDEGIREKGNQTKWFGEIPSRELFGV